MGARLKPLKGLPRENNRRLVCQVLVTALPRFLFLSVFGRIVRYRRVFITEINPVRQTSEYVFCFCFAILWGKRRSEPLMFTVVYGVTRNIAGPFKANCVANETFCRFGMEQSWTTNFGCRVSYGCFRYGRNRQCGIVR